MVSKRASKIGIGLRRYVEDNKLNSDQLTKLYQNKRKCVEREERRVAQKTAAMEESKASMTWDMKQAARNQIFSPEGAFARLSSELFALQERLDPCLAGLRLLVHFHTPTPLQIQRLLLMEVRVM